MEKRRWWNVKVIHSRGLFEAPVHVATVQVDRREWPDVYDALDFAFALTNSFDLPWFKNESDSIAIEPAAADGCRSSSVGDIFSVDGEVYAVLGIGWMRLS